MLRSARASSTSLLSLSAPRALASSAVASYATKRGIEREPFDGRPGDIVSGFQVVKIESVPDVSVRAVSLRHVATGAEYLHLESPDIENAFMVSLRTPPTNDTGVFHILEHTVLCSSEKFHARDVFFSMINRSVNTFMNAWTAPDHTMYPFVTANEADFYNLLSVYLDSVYFPNLRAIDFEREGHHLTLRPSSGSDSAGTSSPTTPSTSGSESESAHSTGPELEWQGVVFNEMKGAMSDVDAIYSHAVDTTLYEGTPYSFNSGGDPLAIPDLTHSQLKETHARHYHPSNSKFVTYGDLNLRKHLAFIEEAALKRFSRAAPASSVPLVGRKGWPHRTTVVGPYQPLAGSIDSQWRASRHYLLRDITDDGGYSSFVDSMLCSLLVDGPTSPMYKALVESGMGQAYSPRTGYSNYMRQASFGVGLSGIRKEKCDDVYRIIQETLEDVSVKGFEKDRIEAYLHQVELSLKHRRSQFGLLMASAISPTNNHDGDPLGPLRITAKVARLERELQAGGLFETLIKRHFLDVDKPCEILMEPRTDYEEGLRAKERARLASLGKAMGREEIAHVRRRAEAVAKAQTEASDPSSLPRIELKDIPLRVLPQAAGEVVDDTNGVSYVSLAVSTEDVAAHLTPYIPLLCEVMTNMQVGPRNHRDFDLAASRATGGVSASPYVHGAFSGGGRVKTGILLKSYSLDRNLTLMHELLSDVCGAAAFTDAALLKVLLSQRATALTNSIADNGHGFAMRAAVGTLSFASATVDTYSGLSQVQLTQELAALSEADLAARVVPLLTDLYRAILPGGSRPLLAAVTTGSEASANAHSAALSALSARLARPILRSGDDGMVGYFKPEFTPQSKRIFFGSSLPVNFCARAKMAVPPSHEDAAALRIMTRILSLGFLLQEIRFLRGAYGAGVTYDRSGALVFYSYRDPQTIKTFETFSACLDYMVDASKVTDETIESAKVAVIAAMDSPLMPSKRDSVRLFDNLTTEARQAVRDSLFAVTRSDLVRVAHKYLGSGDVMSDVVVGSNENKALEDDPSWSFVKL